LPFSVPYYLGIAVNGGQESTPRIPLSMSPYALSVRGTTNTFPNDGNVIIGGTDGDHKLEIQNGNIEIQNDNADAQIRFHDPNDRFMCMGIDQSDSHKFKIGNGAELGDNDFLIINDDNGDTWIKGKLQVHSSEDADLTNGALEIGNEGAQSIAIDGNEIVARNNGEPSTLYLNHSSGNTDVGSNLNVDGDITVNNIAPIMIRRYSLGSHYDIGHNTGVSTTDYSAAIIGADFGWLDYDEDGGGHGWRLLMDKRSDGTWQINGAMHAHQDPPDWTVDVMFIRKELVDDNR